MSILVNKSSRVIIQGITGSQGRYHTKLMLESGTRIVGGVTPNKGGQKVEGLPVFNTVKEAVAEISPDWSVMYVPAKFAKSAALEALENNLHVVAITENLPIADAIQIMKTAKEKKLHVIGPNCPGIVTAEECNLSIMPQYIFQKGDVGVVSRSGSLTYEAIALLSKAGYGQTTAVGIGGDPIVGTTFVEALELFEHDLETKQVLLIGEIGGNLEELAAEYIDNHMSKEVVAYIAGNTAPPGKRMGHAGAVISGSSGTTKAKIAALEKVGVHVAKLPHEIVGIFKKQFG